MTITTENQKSQPDKISLVLNPHSEDFNFELWAREVRQQMLTALRQSLTSSKAKTSP